MKSLLEFYKDAETRENVYNYLVEFMTDEAVKTLFDDGEESAYAIAEAKKIIDKAWDNMDLMFESKDKKKDIINHSR